jgi:protoporphyrinogen oxidase
LVEYTNLRPLGEHVVYVPFYMPQSHPNYQACDSLFKEKVLKYLKIVNSSLVDEDLIACTVSRYRYAQPICGPNFLDGLPSPSLPVPGLYAADTCYYYPEDRGISESVSFGRELARRVEREMAIHGEC